MFSADFQRAISINVDFAFTNLSYSSFICADIQGASFIGSGLNNINFSQANLHKVNLSNARITESQLQTAISIQDAFLPNGTLARDSNFLNNDQTSCNVSFNGSWILHKGNITGKVVHADSNNCYFFLQSYNTGATMSQRLDLLSKWDSKSWPHSLAVLSANMSPGVSIKLIVARSTENVDAHPKLSKF